jgi:hypothetical protein
MTLLALEASFRIAFYICSVWGDAGRIYFYTLPLLGVLLIFCRFIPRLNKKSTTKFITSSSQRCLQAFFVL